MGLYYNRIVVKVGTSTLTNEIGQNNLKAFDCIARVLSDIQNMGYEVILVSSGAIAVGIKTYFLHLRDLDLVLLLFLLLLLCLHLFLLIHPGSFLPPVHPDGLLPGSSPAQMFPTKK